MDPGPQPDRFLTYAEEKKLLAELAPHIRDVAVFSLDSGCCKEECLTLKWPTVVFENDGSVSIIIRAAYSKNRKPVKKPLPNRAAELLRRLRKEHPESSGHVFLGVDGEPIKSIGTGFNAAVRRAGLGDDVTFHTLRHTYASRLAQAGVPLLDISKALNHSSVRMAERYAHLAPSNLKAAVAVLNRVPEPEATVS